MENSQEEIPKHLKEKLLMAPNPRASQPNNQINPSELRLKFFKLLEQNIKKYQDGNKTVDNTIHYESDDSENDLQNLSAIEEIQEGKFIEEEFEQGNEHLSKSFEFLAKK